MNFKDATDQALLEELRNRGNVVINWSPGDMEGFGDASIPAKDRLSDVRKSLQEQSIEAGWSVIREVLGGSESTQARPISIGDAFISLLDEIDTDEDGQERTTPASSQWVVTEINPNGDGPGKPNYGVSCEATGGWIYPGADALAKDFAASERERSPAPRERERGG